VRTFVYGVGDSNNGGIVRQNIILSKEYKARLDAEAERIGLSLSEIVRRGLDLYFKKRGKNDKP
jgi:hypothetical protein